MIAKYERLQLAKMRQPNPYPHNKPSPFLIGAAKACLTIAVVALLGGGAHIYGMSAEEFETGQQPIGQKQAAPKKPVHQKRKYVEGSGNLTITFTNCKANLKGHVSCQIEGDDESSRWVYLPGVALPGLGK